MRDRDKELDDLQKELQSPFIERPEEIDLRDGAMCWLEGRRVCGADCVAFNAEDGLDQRGAALDTPNKCLLLLYMGQQGAAAVGVIALNKKRLQAAADAERAAAPPPPDPRGRKP